MRIQESPRVTVLMPVHGEGTFLSETINSVLEQTYRNIKFLIVLDRPSNNCRELVASFEARDSRIQVMDCPTPGISSALNLGLKQTADNFIARIDADDLMAGHRIERQVRYLIKHPRIDLVGSQLHIFGTSNRESTSYPLSSAKISKALRIRNVIAHPSVMYRREVVVNSGGYKSEFNGAEDYDLWLRIDSGKNLKNLGEYLTWYRVHDNQETSRNRDIQNSVDTKVRLVHLTNSNLSNTKIERKISSISLLNEIMGELKTCNRSSLSSISRKAVKVFLTEPGLAFTFTSCFIFPRLFKNAK